MMRKLEDAINVVKLKGRIEATAAGCQGKEKTSEELKKEIAENREAMADLENKPAKDLEKKELISDPEIRHTKPPIIPTHMDCPFCESEKTIKGMNRHIAEKHEVPGITIQDLDDVEEGLKSLEDLVCEKFEGEPMIANLSPEIEEKEFSNWEDVEENPEDNVDPENNVDPEDIGPEENGASMAIPFVAALIGIATIFFSKDPRLKEIFDKFIDKLKHLGSKKSMDSKKSYGQHAADLYKKRGF